VKSRGLVTTAPPRAMAQLQPNGLDHPHSQELVYHIVIFKSRPTFVITCTEGGWIAKMDRLRILMDGKN